MKKKSKKLCTYFELSEETLIFVFQTLNMRSTYFWTGFYFYFFFRSRTGRL